MRLRLRLRVGLSDGTTLMEMMVVLAILAVVLSVVVPGFERLFASSRVYSEARMLLNAVYLTRAEAIKRNLPVTMCPMDDAVANSHGCGDSYAVGWMIFLNPSRARHPEQKADILAVHDSTGSAVTVLNRAGTRSANERITYFGDGTAHRNLTLMVCSTMEASVDSWSVVLNIVGRPRFARAWGKCPDGA
ncbi:GspH/FimT family pseudopilin [Marinobacter alexandrii]|uniref:GspH/FimT family pseudopilin n=1 Tax=Marinobacter alexandrii TaxID=2570351 RepID=UPI00329DB8F7